MANKFTQAVDGKELAGCFVLYGEEAYLQNYYLKRAISLFDDKLPEFNVHEISAKSMDKNELSDAVESYPAMSDGKLVIVRNLTQDIVDSLDFSKTLKEITQNLPDYTTLIFDYDETCPDPMKGKDLKRVFAQSSVNVCKFEKPGERSLMSWVMRHFKSHGKRISDRDIEYLLSRCGTNMTYLGGEIDKAALYAKGDEVTRRDIDAVTVATVESRVYDMIDAVLKGNFRLAYSTLDEMYEAGSDAIVINAVMSKQYADLLMVKLCYRQTKSTDLTAKRLSMQSWLVRKNVQTVKDHSASELKRAIGMCAQADVELKSSRVDQRTVIETLIGRLMGEKQLVKG